MAIRAFQSSIQPSLPWQETHPQLCQWLESLSPSQIETLKADPDLALAEISVFFARFTILT